MADFPAQVQDYNRVTIHTGSPEATGPGCAALGLNVTQSHTWLTANRAIFVPFVVHATFTAVKMFCANGATVSGNVDVGIYDVAGNRLVSAGSTAQAGASSVQEFDITDTTLAPDLYYLAIALDNTTGTVGSAIPAIGIVSALGVLSQASAFALPSTATFAAAADALLPMVGVTGRTVL